MYWLVLLGVVALYSADGVHYRAEQGETTLKMLADNPYLRLNEVDGEYPSSLEYLQTILPVSNLTVQVVFGDEDGPLDFQDAEVNILNFCDVLGLQIFESNNSQELYAMAKSLAMPESICPIEPGIRTLVPYIFPEEFTTKDLGCGKRYYQMRVQTVNEPFESKAILELNVNLTLTKDNETCIESSSSVMSMPTAIASLITTLVMIKFNK